MSRRRRLAALPLALVAAGALAITSEAVGPGWAQSVRPSTPQSVAAADEPVGGPELSGAGVIVHAPGSVPRPPGVTVAAYVVADMGTGDILAAKAPHQLHRPASTLKMLTGLALLPHLDKTAKYKATYHDDAQIGSAVGIIENHTYTIDQLLLGMFLESGNDAAHALATAAGGMKKTVALMRQSAAKLNARDTTVVNASGLDEDGQFSSAYDLALIARAGMQRPDFRKYVATQRARFPAREQGKTFLIANQNKLLGDYPGTIGVKTGYTSLAKNTFVAAATRNGRTLLVTMMRGQHGISEEAARLLDWGFANADSVEPVGALVDPGSTPRPAAQAQAGASIEDAPGAADANLPGQGLVDRLAETPPRTRAVAAGGLILTLLCLALGMRRRRRRRARRAEVAHWTALRVEHEREYGLDPALAVPLGYVPDHPPLHSHDRVLLGETQAFRTPQPWPSAPGPHPGARSGSPGPPSPDRWFGSAAAVPGGWYGEPGRPARGRHDAARPPVHPMPRTRPQWGSPPSPPHQPPPHWPEPINEESRPPRGRYR